MPRTLRELVWAYQGKEYAESERLSVLLCLLSNINRDHAKRRTPYTPQDFFRRPGSKRIGRGASLTPGAFRAMKGLFTKPKG